MEKVLAILACRWRQRAYPECAAYLPTAQPQETNRYADTCFTAREEHVILCGSFGTSQKFFKVYIFVLQEQLHDPVVL